MFGSKTRELKALRAENAQQNRQITEKDNTIELYEERIIELKKEVERLSRKRGKNGRFVAKNK